MPNTLLLSSDRRPRNGRRSRRDRFRAGLLGLGLGLEAILILVLWAERRRRIRGEQALHRLSAQLLTAQEDERGRIGRDLHDDIGQQLALLAVELDMLEARSKAGASAATRGVADLGGRVRTVATDVQEIARRLYPARLDHLGLVEAVRSLGHSVARRHGVDVEVSAVRWPAETPRWLGSCLYRVAQEALQNVVKHSGAHSARVALQGSSRVLKLTISDGGRGFEPEADLAGAGLGLASMRERLRAVGGTLALHSVPGHGTRIEAIVPRPER